MRRLEKIMEVKSNEKNSPAKVPLSMTSKSSLALRPDFIQE